MYDWSGVRHVSQNNQAYLTRAPLWEKQGVKMYDLICRQGDIFFLDKIERTENAEFREFQLRARDGELGPAVIRDDAAPQRDDWQYLKDHMDASARPGDFAGPEVYRLVSTRAERDEKNATELESSAERGAPSIIIKASNSSKLAAEADEDAIKLHNQLLLCIGARVMIIQNLCVAHGLVNGTTGFVHDILCDAKGGVVAVLVKVKRRTATQDGYSGPSFLSAVEGVDLSTHAIVAITWAESSIYEGNDKHTRTQLPLMLAWAVTVRSQPHHPHTSQRCADMPTLLRVRRSTRHKG